MTQTRVRELKGLSLSELELWQELAAGSGEPNPFFAPEWAVASAHLLPEAAADLGLVTVTDGGRWIAALPVADQRRWGRLVHPLVRGWTHDYGFLGTPLLRAGDEPMAAAALAAALVERRAVAVLELVGESAARWMAAGFEAAGCQVWFRRTDHRALLVRRMRGEGPSTLGAASRKTARRQHRRLAAVLGQESTVTDRAEDPVAVEDFLRLEQSGWKGRQGTAMASRVGHAEWFRTVCSGLRARDRLQLLTLGSPERPVAMACNVLAPGGGMFAVKVAHDAELDHCSPGVLLEIATPAFLQADPRWRWADSCAVPDNALLNRLWPERRSLVTLVAARPGSGTLAVRLAELSRAVR